MTLQDIVPVLRKIRLAMNMPPLGVHPRKFSRPAMVMVVFTQKRDRRESPDALNHVIDTSRDASQRLPETMHGAVCRS